MRRRIYVSIVPSAKGIKGRLTKEMGGPAASAGAEAGGSAGRGFVSRFGSSLVSGLKTVGKRSMQAGMAGLAAVGTTALVKGFGRLVALENAEKRLDSMGLTAKQSTHLMDALNETLQGTPYSLDAGASALARLVSSGADLEAIPGIMNSITDAAAFGQVPMEEVAGVFSRIATNGKLSAMEMEMLADRGIPALNLLADAAGVSAEEFRSMVSGGEVSADDFFSLWEKGAEGFGENNIKMAGAAKDAGDTVQGAWGNALTALARTGAKVLQPLFERIPGWLESATDWVNAFGEAIGPMISSWSKSWPQISQTVSEALEVMRRGFEGVVQWVSANWPKISQTVSTAVETIKVIITTAVDLILAVWRTFGDDLLTFARRAWEPIRMVVEGAMNVIQGVIRAVSAVIRGDWSAMWDGVKQVVSGVWQAIQGIVRISIEAMRLAMAAAWQVIRGAVQTAWDAIASIFRNVWNSITRTVSTAVNTVRDTISFVLTGAKNIVSGLIGDIAGFFTGLPGRIASALSGLWDTITGPFRRAFDWVMGQLAKVTGAIDSLLGRARLDGWGIVVDRLGLPTMHTGGVVPGGASTELPFLLQGGEVVLSRSQVRALRASQPAAPASAARTGPAVHIGQVQVSEEVDVDVFAKRLGFLAAAGSL